ncbi:MAG TPA: methyltransferase [Actinomycetota bacterium]|nr:methyltransferase [Actinomycetota bacterium]
MANRTFEGDDSGARRIQEIAMGYYSSQALYVAARLGIADLVADGPRPVDELAAAVHADPDSLRRILRLLAVSGVFEMDPEGRVGLNAAAGNLRTGEGGSMRDLVLVFGEEFYQAFGNLLSAVRTGRDAFRLTFGRGLFEYLEKYPDRARAFDRAMGAGEVFFHTIPSVYDFSGFDTIADVGGGNGTLLASILGAHPQLRGVLFDAALVVEAAAGPIEALGLAGRVDLVAGDFFESIVPGADAYLFSRILHDWTDDRCRTILGNCRRAIGPDGRILVVERLLPGAYATATDVNMLAVTGGRERSEDDFAKLMADSGFQLTRVLPIPLEYNLIEGVPA